MAITNRANETGANTASGWFQVAGSTLEVRVFDGSVGVEMADDGAGTKRVTVCDGAQPLAVSAGRACYLDVVPGRFYRLVSAQPGIKFTADANEVS